MIRCLIFVCALFFPIVIQAHPPISVQAQEAEVHNPTVGDYEEALKHHTHWSENIGNPNFYKNLEFTMVKDKKKVKFSEINEFEKNLFYIYQAENLSNRLVQIESIWRVELSRLTDVDGKDENAEGALTEERLKKIAARKDVLAYLKKIYILRENHAVRYEKLITDVFVKFKDEIPESDRENYSEQVRSWHDKQKLIKRAIPKPEVDKATNE